MIGRKHKIKQKHGEQKGELNRNREEKIRNWKERTERITDKNMNRSEDRKEKEEIK